MHIRKLEIRNHPLLKDIDLDFCNEEHKPYPVVVFVGENGCGKTSLLSEIFNYESSEYIVNKEICHSYVGEKPFASLFIRQDSKYSGAMNELTKRISGGKDPFPTEINTELSGGQNVLGLRVNTGANNRESIEDFAGAFQSELIANAVQTNKIKDVNCGGEVLRSVSGEKSSIDLTTMSSGEQELLLKIKALQNIKGSTDFVLFDEPETSLHPRWQRVIVKELRNLVQPNNGEDMFAEPQIFLATHSEKVLESLVDKKDILIIRLSKNKGIIKAERIEQMELVLPKPTFAELDCVVFNIISFDYHDELFAMLSDLVPHKYEEGTVLDVDRYIRSHSRYLVQEDLFRKKWETSDPGRGTKTLPSYIRNYFHHPHEDRSVSEKELRNSIELLRTLLKEFKK